MHNITLQKTELVGGEVGFCKRYIGPIGIDRLSVYYFATSRPWDVTFVRMPLF